jgi:hypothetical protein
MFGAVSEIVELVVYCMIEVSCLCGILLLLGPSDGAVLSQTRKVQEQLKLEASVLRGTLRP